MLYILSGATCAGKNTVYEELEKSYKVERIVTTTTRAPRKCEVHGTDYFFISREEFLQRVLNEEFLEHNEYAGEYYGTRWEQVKAAVEAPKVVFAILDVNGTFAIKKQFPQAVSIFIEPPSFEELRVRILRRGENTPEEIERRLEIAKEEMKQAVHFDYRVVNDNAAAAVSEIWEIVNG